jgi:hypothetical protein
MESEHLGVLPHHIAPTARPKVASASPQSFHFCSTSPTICNECNLVQDEQRDCSHPLGRRPDAQALFRPRLLARLSCLFPFYTSPAPKCWSVWPDQSLIHTHFLATICTASRLSQLGTKALRNVALSKTDDECHSQIDLNVQRMTNLTCMQLCSAYPIVLATFVCANDSF